MSYEYRVRDGGGQRKKFIFSKQIIICTPYYTFILYVNSHTVILFVKRYREERRKEKKVYSVSALEYQKKKV